MYALTHKILIDEIINAHKKAVAVKLYLDSQMVKGAMKNHIKILKDANIEIFLRAKGGLNHHKCALIDDTYIFGSANWSHSGFKKNEETLIFLNVTDKKVKSKIDYFFKNLHFYSVDF
jgi:phosphatidylserine/phosphatidylglycerophosphate/cardiolipin synthase-like enzyme